MTKRSFYLLVAGLGLLVMAFGQFMSRPQFYGTEFGRAWAHVFWFGFLLFLGPILIWFTKYIAHHKNPAVVDAGKYQVAGILGVTGVVGIITTVALILGNDTLLGFDGGARRGAFVLWLLLLTIFTIVNLAVLLFRQLKLMK